MSLIRTIAVNTFALLITISWSTHSVRAQKNNLPSSPCPRVFQYKFDGEEWYGELDVPSPPIEHREVILQVSLSLRAATNQNNVGTITLLGTPQEATDAILQRQPLQFRVQFPYRYPIPKLVKIIYDDNLLCSGPEEIPNASSIVSRIELRHVLNTYTNFRPNAINIAMNAMMNNNNFNSNNNAFFDPMSNANSPEYDFIQHFSMGHFMPSTIMHNNNRPFIMPQRPMMPFQPSVNIAMTTTNRYPIFATAPTTTTSRPMPSAINSNINVLNDICGTRYSASEVTPLVFGGEETKRGEWPWMVAIYLNKPTGLSFNCGGSLVSPKAVISAAHCINTSTKNYQPHEVLLWLGRYSLIDWSEIGAISSNVQQIIIHKDYMRQRESYDADIAILVMEKSVEFNEYIRPVCLWSGSPNIQHVEGLKGTVVGWGKDGTDKIVSNIPKKVDLPIVNTITCVQTSESLYKAVSNRTFCAGTLNGDGPCHGDSGGGLTLYRNNRWTLRGIVSAGLSDANSGACKLMDYVVFTDVSLFSSWIRTNLPT